MDKFGLLTWILGMVCGMNLAGLGLSFWIIEGGGARSQIQDRTISRGQFRERLPLIALNLSVLVTLTACGLWLLGDLFVWEGQSALRVCWQIAAIALVDDFFFYCFHRALHENKWLYKHIHKIHHKSYTPLPIEYIYVHPLEWMGGALGVLFGVGLVLLLDDRGVTPLAFMIYSILRNLHELDIHSGFRSRWFPKWLPFLGCTEHHDLHHAKPHSGNYGSTFLLWDTLFKTRAKHS